VRRRKASARPDQRVTFIDRHEVGLDRRREGRGRVSDLSTISDKKNALIKRIDNIDRIFLQAELAELDIQAGWDD
jgi:hypothetical protein